jgi:hypothetical protein
VRLNGAQSVALIVAIRFAEQHLAGPVRNRHCRWPSIRGVSTLLGQTIRESSNFNLTIASTFDRDPRTVPKFHAFEQSVRIVLELNGAAQRVRKGCEAPIVIIRSGSSYSGSGVQFGFNQLGLVVCELGRVIVEAYFGQSVALELIALALRG